MIALLLASSATTSHAQSVPDDFWAHWFDRSDRSKSEQPHWVTPLATTTPRLEQEVRYDLVWQRRPDGSTLENSGNSKGLELIPAEKVKVILGVPAYVVHDQAPARNGFADWRVLWNNALQYQLFRRLWPEVEINTTFFQQGKNDGQQQTFVTPGLVVGRLPLTDRLGLTIGAGIQLAVSRFRTTTHNAVLSVRLPF